MNYYERIQKSINYIEENLEGYIDLSSAAREAFMSLSNFYRMFFALAGYSVKEYIRLRRMSLAGAEMIKSDVKLIELAVKYGFDSQDAFSRAFKRITGFLPSEFRKKKVNYSFERIDIMDKYFDIQDNTLLEKYPDIKVLKVLEPMRVAYCSYYGLDPETHAFNIMKEWLVASKPRIVNENTRIFGYNNPNPATPEQREYGYEVCVTIGDSVVEETKDIGVKTLEGGLYAVCVVNTKSGDMGQEIALAWKRFGSWLKDSKYAYGGHQWLEEHLGFDDEFQHLGGIDLYMPIVEKTEIDTKKSFINVEPMFTAAYKAEGKNAAEKARKYILKWAQAEGFFKDGNKHRFFAYYNPEKIGQRDFWFTIHVSVEGDFTTTDPNISLEEFKGGKYAVMKSKFKYNGWAWEEFINWVNKSMEYSFGQHWFFEEYLVSEPKVEMETDMELYMPLA